MRDTGVVWRIEHRSGFERGMDRHGRGCAGVFRNGANAGVEDGSNGCKAPLFQRSHRSLRVAGPVPAPSPGGGTSSSVDGCGSNQPIVLFVLFNGAAAASPTCCKVTASTRAASDGTTRQLAIVSK